jgi:hypothetical protein
MIDVTTAKNEHALHHEPREFICQRRINLSIHKWRL